MCRRANCRWVNAWVKKLSKREPWCRPIRQPVTTSCTTSHLPIKRLFQPANSTHGAEGNMCKGMCESKLKCAFGITGITIERRRKSRSRRSLDSRFHRTSVALRLVFHVQNGAECHESVTCEPTKCVVYFQGIYVSDLATVDWKSREHLLCNPPRLCSFE
jgi:hypothetical protein